MRYCVLKSRRELVRMKRNDAIVICKRSEYTGYSNSILTHDLLSARGKEGESCLSVRCVQVSRGI